MATCAASEASPAARVSRSGTARRRREQRQRGVAKHVAWLTSLVQSCSSHHSGAAVGQVLARLALLDARLAKTEAAVLGYGAASPPARPAPVVAAEAEAKGEVSPTVMAEVTANHAMEQDAALLRSLASAADPWTVAPAQQQEEPVRDSLRQCGPEVGVTSQLSCHDRAQAECDRRERAACLHEQPSGKGMMVKSSLAVKMEQADVDTEQFEQPSPSPVEEASCEEHAVGKQTDVVNNSKAAKKKRKRKKQTEQSDPDNEVLVVEQLANKRFLLSQLEATKQEHGDDPTGILGTAMQEMRASIQKLEGLASSLSSTSIS